MLTPLPFLETPCRAESYIHPNLLITQQDIQQALAASDDPRTQVAAFIVSPLEGHIIARGTNGFANWSLDKGERTGVPEKYSWFVHAESRAICNAAKRGVRTEDARIYITLPPCLSCANQIIAAGISEVIVPGKAWESLSTRWSEDCFRAIQAFHEVGIGYTEL